MSRILLTHRFHSALQYAAELHRNQLRKGTKIPYLSHLLSVAAMVIEDGGDEDQAIAALLHDAAEDQGGARTLEDIRSLYGDHVAQIVECCSDTFKFPKPPWKERKRTYLAHLENESEAVLRVSLADKLHNARSILRDLHTLGDQTWSRFNGGKEGTLWYYRSLVEIFCRKSNSPMVRELQQVVGEIEALSG